MQFITFKRDGQWTGGMTSEGRIVPLSSLCFEESVKTLLNAGPHRVAAVLSGSQRAFKEKNSVTIALEAVELGPPVPDPDKILCIGLNYRDHAEESNLPIPAVPVVFAKYRNSLIGTKQTIELPAESREIDYEVELAVVIGRKCRGVPESEALGYVAGYTVFNDVSARDLQFATSQWTMGKALDTFAPMGPGLIPVSAVPNPQKLELKTWVNGELLQSGSTANMIFSVAQIIEFLSRYMTLVPGDIIATGTPAGVGFTRKPPRFINSGDLVETEITSLGRLRNPAMRR